MLERNSRTEMLIGADAMRILENSRVAVFGVGGVGGYAVEALARAGVGAIDIVDCDTVSESNINRQIIATYKTLGMKKTDAAEERIVSINPLCRVKKYDIFFLPENANDFDFSVYDYVVDAIDTVSGKLAIITKCSELGVPVISSMGTGNKLDPTAFEITDIYSTSVCPLARVMRTELRKRGVSSLKVLYSKEPPKKAIQLKSTEGEAQNRDINRRSTPASISFVPSVGGLIIASEVIKDITGIRS